ncbi:hypothetical protein [Pseudomonas fluorescens group sp. PF-69]
MAHSLRYRIGESIRVIEAEIERLLDIVDTLKAAGNDDLASVILAQVHRLIGAAVALKIAAAG